MLILEVGKGVGVGAIHRKDPEYSGQRLRKDFARLSVFATLRLPAGRQGEHTRTHTPTYARRFGGQSTLTHPLTNPNS